MVQATHLWKLDDRFLLRGHHRPRNRAVLCQRPMWTRGVIVLEESLEDSLEMSFADDRAVQHQQLVPQCQVLNDEVTTGVKCCGQASQDRKNE